MSMMSKGFALVTVVSVAFAILFAGCGDSGDPISMDTILEQDTVLTDSITDSGVPEDLPVERDVVADTYVEDGLVEDTNVTQDVFVDTGSDTAEIGEDTAVTDEGAADTAEDTFQGPVSCNSYDDCADDESCLFSLGVCQQRATWTSATLGLFNIHSMDGAANDRLILDGEVFSTGVLSSSDKIWVKIGTSMVYEAAISKDENRAFFAVTASMQGPITVYYVVRKDDKDVIQTVATIPGPFKQSAKGQIACDGTTPEASGMVPDYPWEAGPYAAGYVDIKADWGGAKTRVYYPAKCGSIRRPAETGTWPLVVILHGNGALHLQYEYLAELFATWGFVSIMPMTIQNLVDEDYSQLVFDTAPVIERFRGRELSGENAVLTGITTTEDIFFIGHSRGTGRAEELANISETGLWDYTLGAIYLGPVDDFGRIVPGYLMVFGGGKDMQSNSMTYKSAYNEHPGEKWLIEMPGGNHGSFCDHKVYGYGLGALGDAEPTISRHEQHLIVQTYAVPLLQRAFGQDEPFADYLDNPVNGTYYTIQHEAAEE